MKIDATFPLRRIWLVCILVAVCIGAPLSFFANSAPWVIAIPIVAGVAVLCLMEISGWFSVENAQLSLKLPLVKAPAGFFGLTKYKGHVALTSHAEEDKWGQELFSFLNVQRKKSTKSTRIIRDPETGEPIYLIDTERFVALLLAHALPDAEKITEFALQHALHRFGEMEGISNDLEKFLLSKTALETMKADLKANTSQTINNASEAALREAIKGVTKEIKARRTAAATTDSPFLSI